MALVNGDRKSTRLNSSHGYISYAVFCLKKKNGTGNGDDGIHEQKTPVEILPSYISHNAGTGVFINQCATTITNSIIVRNFFLMIRSPRSPTLFPNGPPFR